MIAAGGLVWGLVFRLVPVVREAVKATRKASPGGRKITRAERDRILGALLGGVAEIVDGPDGLFGPDEDGDGIPDRLEAVRPGDLGRPGG